MEEKKNNLPPLQLSVYNYVLKNKKVEYSKNNLLKALKLTSQTVLTRGVNSLLKKSLIEELKEGEVIYLKVTTPNKSKESEKEIEKNVSNEFKEVVGEKVELVINTNEKVDIIKENEVEEVELPQVHHISFINNSPELTESSEVEQTNEQIVIKEEVVETKEKMFKQGTIDEIVLDNPTKTASMPLEEIKVEEPPKEEVVIEESSKRSEETKVVKIETKQTASPVIPKEPQKISPIVFKPTEVVESVTKGVETTSTSKKDSESTSDIVNERAGESVVSNTQLIGLSKIEILKLINSKNNIKSLVNTLKKDGVGETESQLVVLLTLYHYFLEKGKWIDNHNAELMSATGLSKRAFIKAKKELIETGKIATVKPLTPKGMLEVALTLKGAERVSSLLKQYRAKHLVQKLTNAVVNKTKVVTASTPVVRTSFSQDANYDSHIYLIDTENVGLPIQKSILEKLTKNDVVLLCLSDKSGKTKLSSEQLHWILEAKCQVKSVLVQTDGKGRNDLDHVLVAELVLLLTQMPKSQFIILSKDQGYLAAIKHLIERLKLEQRQILLKRDF